jgi:phage tail protein X
MHALGKGAQVQADHGPLQPAHGVGNHHVFGKGWSVCVGLDGIGHVGPKSNGAQRPLSHRFWARILSGCRSCVHGADFALAQSPTTPPCGTRYRLPDLVAVAYL